MPINKQLKQIWMRWLEHERFQLARPDALIHLALMGLITGFLAGAVIIIFRVLVEGAQESFLPGNSSENYEGLSSLAHFSLPVLGGLLLAWLYYVYAEENHMLGIAKVIDRLSYHQGYLTARGFFLQFIGAAIAIICGHSVGREGPHVYLGASISSLFAQAASLPNNSIRVMVACGVAAGVSASFNTPLAGMIFALEVVMMEFSIGSFVPIILASAVATGMSNAVFGLQPAFIVPTMNLNSLLQLPLVLILGAVIGSVAALFIQMIKIISQRSKPIAIWWRLIAAGIITGLCALAEPAVMGIGYDSISNLLREPTNFTLVALFSLVAFKLLATSACVGLGVPAGMIGPAFILGATMGAIAGNIVSFTAGWQPSDIGFYALLGMGAMVGASLQAPLAALTAIIELTYSPGIVMPAMLAIVSAQLMSRVVFKQDSLFMTLLRTNEQNYKTNPISQTLRRIGVASLVKKNFIRSTQTISKERASGIIDGDREWIVISRDERPAQLLAVSELARHMTISPDEAEDIDLLNIPADRAQLSPLALQSNLHEAHQKFQQGAEALYVVFKESSSDDSAQIYGIVLPDMVDSAYRI